MPRAIVLALLLGLFTPQVAFAAKVPDLRGKTVAQAARALERAGLKPEAGERLQLVKPDERVPRFTARAPGRVTSQSVRPGASLKKGTVVAVSTVGPRKPQVALLPIQWKRIAFADGTITLTGVDRWGDCMNYDHAQVGPDTGGVRLITVWARNYGVGKVNCERKPRAFVLTPGPDWTVNTIGVAQIPDTPNPAMTDDQAIVEVAGSLQPDGQTVVASFTHGACDEVADATATVEGNVATLRVVLGGDPHAQGGECPAIAYSDTVLIRLPAPVAADTRLVSAPCRKPDQPGIPEPLPCYTG